MIMLSGEGGLECEVHMDGMRLEHTSEFKYSGYVLGETGTDVAEGHRKMPSGRKIASTIN